MDIVAKSEPRNRRKKKQGSGNEDIISMTNVTKSYATGAPALNGIDLHIKPGEFVFIVGDSGSGKSTLLKLILGYYSIQKGRIISFDKEPVIIRQEEHLFSGTIRENLCLGENFSEEDLTSAMEFANISDLDLNQFVSEDAGNLSGGQIQRISIARAKLHCHNLLLCDEITSSLDSINTEKIERNIIELTDKTIIYVTHKIHKKMLQEFDDILVLSHGKLVEHGSFEDLLCKKNYFYHLFMNQ